MSWLIATLQSILNRAVRLDKITTNLGTGVRKIANKIRDRRLSVAEIKKIDEAIRCGKQHGEHSIVLGIVELLLLTGCQIPKCMGYNANG